MRIAAAALERFAGALPMPVGNGQLTWQRREGLLLRLSDDEEEMGQGEASPLPGYSPDTLEEAAAVLKRVSWEAMPELDLAAPVAVEFPRFFDQVGRALDAMLPVERSPAARFAAETAILDLAGRSLDVPAHQLLAGRAAPHAIALNAWIQGLELETVFAAVEGALARGIVAMKFKVGRPGRFEEEIRLLAALRERFGDHIALRLDANEAWTLAEARTHLAALAAVTPEYVEQPVAAGLLPELTSSPVPLAADESLRDPSARARLLAPPGSPPGRPGEAARACQVFVLKPMVLGGIIAARDLAREAAASGIGVVVSHLLDGPVAFAAALELALSLRPAPLASGLDLHPGLAAWPETIFPQFRGGEIRACASGGLGLGPIPPAGS
jgi:o-succinylbenzoate synthase